MSLVLDASRTVAFHPPVIEGFRINVDMNTPSATLYRLSTEELGILRRNFFGRVKMQAQLADQMETTELAASLWKDCGLSNALSMRLRGAYLQVFPWEKPEYALRDPADMRLQMDAMKLAGFYDLLCFVISHPKKALELLNIHPIVLPFKEEWVLMEADGRRRITLTTMETDDVVSADRLFAFAGIYLL